MYNYNYYGTCILTDRRHTGVIELAEKCRSKQYKFILKILYVFWIKPESLGAACCPRTACFTCLIYMLFLSEGQTDEAWKGSKK